MLIRNSGAYLLARGVPALINVLAIALYTRLLSPSDYGIYALVLALVTFGNALFFEWLQGSVLRFCDTYQDRMPALLSSVAAGYLGALLVIAMVAIPAWFLLAEHAQPTFIPWVVVLLSCWGAFELALKFKVARQLPLEFGLLNASKAMLALLLGGFLAWHNQGPFSIIAGYSIAIMLAWLLFARKDWNAVEFRAVDRTIFKQLLRYGAPLTATFALSVVIATSDRLLLAWLRGTEATGFYAAGYDIPNYALSVLLMVIYLSGYPLTIRALEQHGREAARKQLDHYAKLLLTVGVPSTAGMAILAPGIAQLALGENFREYAIQLIPLIALASLIASLKTYYLDLAFQLGKQTVALLRILLIAAAINIVLNLLLIPQHGVFGAAWATLASHGLALLLSLVDGKKHFDMPLPLKDGGKILIATIAMSAAIWPMRDLISVIGVLSAVVLGVVVFLAAAWLLNISDLRQHLSTGLFAAADPD